jgi:hypothetical protein
MNPEKAVGTANDANDAKTEPTGKKERFTQWEKKPFDSTPFPFAYLACFVV